MKNLRRRHLSLALASIIALPHAAHAFVINPTENADALASTLILPDSGISVTSASVNFGFGESSGGGIQTGTYTNDDNTYGLPGPGIVLSSGFVENYQSGPNTSDSFSGYNGNIANAAQNDLLSPVTGQSTHFDPAQLSISFDVSATTESISFFASFGSEEWPDFVGSEFSDGFALVLNGENVAGALASDAAPGDNPLTININHPDMADIPGTELNGVLAPNGLPVLRFDIPVEPGSTGNVFEIIVADAADDAYDTTVYISSFGDFSSSTGSSEFTPILPSNPEDLEGGFIFDLPEVDESEIVWIDPDIATGYTYVATDGGMFDVVVAPSQLAVNDSDGYNIEYINELGEEVTVALAPGQSHAFSAPVDEFTISGIDEELMLDPIDPLAFVTGLSFADSGSFGVIQTPITTFVDDGTGGPPPVDPPTEPPTTVSEPSSLALIALGMLGLGIQRRRKLSV